MVLTRSGNETGSVSDRKGKSNFKKKVPRLPPEMWRHILTFIRGSDRFLLQLRLVSRQWRAFIDELLRENSAPYLINSWNCQQNTGNELWIRNRPFVASRFDHWSQLEDALAFDSDSSTGSPFPTGVVIMCPYFGKKASYMWEDNRQNKYVHRVAPFLSRFRKWITTLVYIFNKLDTELRPSLLFHGSLLKMPSLQNLFMYVGQWDLDPRGLLQPPDVHIHTRARRHPPLLSLHRLQLGRDTESHQKFYWDRLTPILLFARFPSVLENLTSLEFDLPSHSRPNLLGRLGRNPEGLLHCPQLQRLKIGNPTLEFLRCFCKPEAEGPQLKELSLVMEHLKAFRKSREEIFLFLRGLIPLLDVHSETLASFTLQVLDKKVHHKLRSLIEQEGKTEVEEDEPNFFLEDEIGVCKFPRLKEVNLSLSSLMEFDWWLEFRTLFRKFPKLERVTAFGNPESVRGVTEKRFKYLVTNFLELMVPKTVAGIRMPGYGDRFEARGQPEVEEKFEEWWDQDEDEDEPE